jgi:hypothetical protein
MLVSLPVLMISVLTVNRQASVGVYFMSYDQAIKWFFIAVIAIVDIVLLFFCRLEVRIVEYACAAWLAGLFSLIAFCCYRLGFRFLAASLIAWTQIYVSGSVVVLLTYLVTSLNFPMADPWLQAFDALVGFSPAALVGEVRANPVIDSWSLWFYDVIALETILTVVLMAFLRKRVLLEQFVCQMMAGGAVCAISGCFLPGAGPAYNHGIDPADWQLSYLNHFLSLRSGETFVFSLQEAEGIITFPSFHTAWAIMLILVWRQQTKWLSVPVGLVSLLIILSTLTTASHYSIDLIGGAFLALFCWWVSERVTAFSYQEDGNPKRIVLGQWSKLRSLGDVTRDGLETGVRGF